ncbi:hypothetical protein Hdeb2414_s0013g00412821 [Helianthus debilis subsp. tardiflorus]
MASNSTSQPPSSDEEEEQEANSTVQKPNSNSIDNSLDAIENQLSSISFTSPIDETLAVVSAEYYHESISEINDSSLNGSYETVGEIPIDNNNSVGESSHASGSRVWMNNNMEVEVEAEVDGGLSSPSSSGYAGERGSSGGSVSSSYGTDVIREVRDNGESVGDDGVHTVDSVQAEWISGKRHADEL